jgi:hypothetical protein
MKICAKNQIKFFCEPIWGNFTHAFGVCKGNLTLSAIF